MDTRAPRRGVVATSPFDPRKPLARLARALTRHVRSPSTWWLSGGGGLVVLASCTSGASSGLLASASPPTTPEATTDGGALPDAWTPTAWPPEAGPDADTDASSAPGFDYSVFATTIQPILDTAGTTGCTNTSCHGSATGQGGLILTRQPAAGTPQMKTNFEAITALCNTAIPDQSLFYTQATNNHGGISVSQTQASTILSWIQHASAPPTAPPTGDAGTPTSTCIPASSFNLGVFAAEIQPILFGTLDYNQSPDQPVANNGCARASCHGAATNPLNISTSNTPLQNLTNVACFIKLANPSASPLLLCPLNDPGCPKSPHPGQDVFASEQDLNYQRIASWLYSVQGAASPLDFAFFARQVAPIFDDPASGGIAGGQRTCADTTTCHGVSAAGQAPPNLSNFPILASATSEQGFKTNYWSAANFTNFLTPTGSEIFLYPTNLIANTANQPYATGLAHPGGVDFIPSSTQAQAILQWATGLQPDANGDVLNWLVAGTYDATLVTQTTEAGNDATLSPSIFDPDGASQFNGGIWDLDSSPNEFVDLNAEFPGATGSGRVAYAVANAINATGSDLQQAQIMVTSPNAVLLYVGSESSEGSLAGNNTVNLSTTLPAFATEKSTTRILVKVLQRPGDTQFGFTLNVEEQNNQPIPSGELIFRLDSKGGI